MKAEKHMAKELDDVSSKDIDQAVAGSRQRSQLTAISAGTTLKTLKPKRPAHENSI